MLYAFFRKFWLSLLLLILCACTSTVNTANNPTSNITSANTETATPYFAGSGGKGMRLGILLPESQGLNENQVHLPTLIQGVLVTNILKYSAISVLDRVSLDRVIAETLDPIYEDNLDIVTLGHVSQVGYMMTGRIIQTSLGYSLQINVTDTTPDAKTIASYSGIFTARELDDQTAIQKASLDLLTQMGVSLTSRAKDELVMAGTVQAIDAQVALARGITAQRQGTEVEALSYYYQAMAFDPSLLEAVNRSSVLSANISSGNIGADVRNDIIWRREWVARLTATEESFYQMLDASDPPYTLFYSTAIEQGAVNYQTETVDLSIPINLHGIGVWFNSVQKALQVVYDGLNATKKKSDWGLGNWPQQGVSNTNPFARGKQYDIPVVFELLNQQKQVIGRKTARLTPSFSFSGWGTKVSINYNENNFSTVSFNAVKADDITNNLTIRIASVNSATPENVTLRITALSGQKWQEYRSGTGLEYLHIRDGVLRGFNPSLSNELKAQYRDLIIPAEKWGDPFIVSIADDAFSIKPPNTDRPILTFSQEQNKIGLTSVTIPYGVTSIGKNAFSNNRLANLTIPNSVTFIGEDAFGGNNLNSVTIPNSVTSIGYRAFRYNALTSVTIPDSVTLIQNDTFKGNPITSITIGANVILGEDFSFPGSFGVAYNSNGRKSGTYTRKGSGTFDYKWSFKAQ